MLLVDWGINRWLGEQLKVWFAGASGASSSLQEYAKEWSSGSDNCIYGRSSPCHIRCAEKQSAVLRGCPRVRVRRDGLAGCRNPRPFGAVFYQGRGLRLIEDKPVIPAIAPVKLVGTGNEARVSVWSTGIRN